MTAHKAIGTARILQIDEIPDFRLLKGRIHDRLVHKTERRFVIGATFDRETHTVIGNAIAQFAVFEESRRLHAHRERISPVFEGNDFAGCLNYTRKHTRANIEKGERRANTSIALAWPSRTICTPKECHLAI
jgi:hypothetical protein